MILQNISRAIREQNYYAVALEFVIVIAGVVIGFQINAWNEARQINALKNETLVRLKADFDFLADDIDSALAFHQRNLDGLGAVRSSLESDQV